MTATNTAVNASITATNIAIAAQAQQAADEARRDRCRIEMTSYNAKGATVTEMQSYAGCVDFVYPAHTEANAAAWKIVVGILLLGFMVGAVVGFCRSWSGGLLDKAIDAIFTGVIGVGLSMLGLILVASVMFIFS